MRPLVEALVTKKNIKNIVKELTYVIFPFRNDSYLLTPNLKSIDDYKWNIYAATKEKIKEIYGKTPEKVFLDYKDESTRVWETFLSPSEVKEYYNANFNGEEYKYLVKKFDSNKNFKRIK